MEHREVKTNTEGSITVSLGKPNKDGDRGASVEWTVKKFEGETDEVYEKRYNYFKDKALRELI